ncbi:expressed unknown protein [Seminavis robusta]|uniref:Fungal lipase-type domain-containing protein n=1 Tax=Seminavis robusta TaxID=568900 RepID=A0A9N8HRZ0_9STRA|nr:expressed unknown protein [Seminavis robusta]|eukprot:Sro1455_g274160.1 n/a (266) ;mRNA; r:15834-16722
MEPNPGFESFQVFEDINDCAVVARKGDTCMAVFQATNFDNPLDVMQLLDYNLDTVGSCTFRAGIVSAYRSSYYEGFVREVDRCMSMTRNMHAKLILGGHSQGGAIAVVASADLKRHNPTVVTFGSIRALHEDCPDVVPENHYRFANALHSTYDYWPMVMNKNGDHFGHAVYLDPMSSNLATYTGLNDDTNREPTDMLENHDPDIYYVALSQLIHAAPQSMQCASGDGAAVIGLRMLGWEDGHYCIGADECKGSFCTDNHCASTRL